MHDVVCVGGSKSRSIGNAITSSKSATVFELYLFQLPVVSKGSNGGTGAACAMYDVFPSLLNPLMLCTRKTLRQTQW